ncbi:TetR/AcrR family transcriptional regulator [Stakelama sp. CBK3Z-3]|uniref:TetR/AcrR family transcriptional regulator n=1 Tax=Stakelama flava TaxID=2860338 RepID=A0ABS6XQD4_9SPHN|nr:TetR/AcrR family transcriptional regulator [Stakelama flava]MBW4332331.1 TetR/AcrR family transcriptional regulator [Stakelama flava]
MRYDANHKHKTHDRLLDEASRLIRTSGPEGLSVAKVMSAAGLTVGGFYAHFESKDDLLNQAVERAIADFTGLLYDEAEGMSAEKQLTRIVRYYLSAPHRDTPEKGCLLPVLGSRMATMNEDARQVFAIAFGRMKARLEQLLTLMGRSDAEEEAQSAVAEMIGALTLARAVPDIGASDQILAASVASILSRLSIAEQ